MRIKILGAALAVVGVMLVPAGAGAEPGVAATTCLGKPVTIVASTSVTVGTGGDDVVAMTPSGWNSFDALGGNDTICLALGMSSSSPRDGQQPMGEVNAGDGNDVVVNEATSAPDALMRVGLGAGDDRFVGNDTSADVFADSAVDYSRPTTPPEGTQRDDIAMGSGGGAVTSAAPGGALNNDRITFGGGNPRVTYVGAMGPQGLVDFGTTGELGSLTLPSPNTFEPAGRGELLVDNVARRATAGGAQVLTWSGNVAWFYFGEAGRISATPLVSFIGSDAVEHVWLADQPVGDVRLGGGDDELDVAAYNNAFVPRSADGGPGADTVSLDNTCATLRVEVTRLTACDGSPGAFSGFEDVIASGADSGTVELIGSTASERLVASGGRVSVRGRGGADVILVDGAATARVDGGAGNDDILAAGGNVLVRGRAGRDHIVLGGPRGGASARPRQIVLGGRGADDLTGTSEMAGDRLIGGRGKDSANGKGGKLDWCVAEVTKNCELP